MKTNMIRHFLSLKKNGGKLIKRTLNENEIILCDGYFFFIQDRSKMVLNENMFMELEKDFMAKYVKNEGYTEGKIACYLPTYRKNKFNILIKNKDEDKLENRVIISGEKLELFDYEKLEIGGQNELVKLYDGKGKFLGGILPIKCSEEAYII